MLHKQCRIHWNTCDIIRDVETAGNVSIRQSLPAFIPGKETLRLTYRNLLNWQPYRFRNWFVICSNSYPSCSFCIHKHTPYKYQTAYIHSTGLTLRAHVQRQLLKWDSTHLSELNYSQNWMTELMKYGINYFQLSFWNVKVYYLKFRLWWVAQLVRALSPYAKVAGLIPGQSTYKNQPMSV